MLSGGCNTSIGTCSVVAAFLRSSTILLIALTVVCISSSARLALAAKESSPSLGGLLNHFWIGLKGLDLHTHSFHPDLTLLLVDCILRCPPIGDFWQIWDHLFIEDHWKCIILILLRQETNLATLESRTSQICQIVNFTLSLNCESEFWNCRLGMLVVEMEVTWLCLTVHPIRNTSICLALPHDRRLQWAPIAIDTPTPITEQLRTSRKLHLPSSWYLARSPWGWNQAWRIQSSWRRTWPGGFCSKIRRRSSEHDGWVHWPRTHELKKCEKWELLLDKVDLRRWLGCRLVWASCNLTRIHIKHWNASWLLQLLIAFVCHLWNHKGGGGGG